MRLVNDTPYDAELFRSEMPSGRMMASLLIRVVHPLDDAGRLGPASADAPALIRRDLVATEDCDLAPEIVFPRTATDVLILGSVTVAEPVARAHVRIAVGPYEHVLTVHGDRVWERVHGDLHPSSPAMFTTLPLSWDLAYGGVAPTDYGPMPCPANPRGRGYYLRETDARDQALPNIEWSGEEVTRWDDRPEPAIVGAYPSAWWSRLQKTWEFDVAGRKLAAHPEAGLFDQAHPRLSGRDVRPGDRLRIDGLGLPIADVLPACPVRATFILGDRRHTRELTLEEVLVDARRRRVELAWRKLVQYEYVRHEERATIVTQARP